MQGFRKFWVFKSLGNFSLFVFFVSETAYLATKYNNERNLHHPVVTEALRLAEKDDQISEMLGFPISWSSNARNFLCKSDKLYNAEFFIEGPKWKLFLRVGAECLPLEVIKADHERLNKEVTEHPADNLQVNLTKKNKLEGFYILDPKTESFYERYAKNHDAKLHEIELPAQSLFWGIGYLFADFDAKNCIILIPKLVSNRDGLEKDVRTYNIDANANMN